ncbi:hypothetical protein AK830_g3224 [Neonectria ditissima]|uniref:Uncharacterized protein n=1 Tax=Neonectria ditissima TaxID=78410 RepID=A0A0P7B019_9HYPO|nr:hypothetical protein AK830_g3224 [Neonectria ditissima]
MDPFRYLAPELRTMILCELPSRSDIIRASHASPVLLQQRGASRLAILKGFLSTELPGHLMQDAVAIVTFPDPTGVSMSQQTLLADAHLKQWARKELPDPMERPHLALLLRVDSLVLRLKLFMADYVAKATSTYLPRAYASLPDWAHASFSRELAFPDDSRDGFGLDALTELERYRLMRAFLRYELMCKAYPMRPSTVPAWRGTKDWDWSRLSAYESDPAEFPGGGMEEPSDPEMFQCVHEYLRTLYGALMARLVTPQGARIELSQESYPAPSDPTERQRGRLFPDNLQFDPEQHMADWDASSIFGIRHTYMDRMAGCGFDLVLSLLTQDATSCSLFFEQFYDEVTFRHPERASFGCRRIPLRDDADSASLSSTLGSGLWRSKVSDFDEARRDDSLHHAFRRMYRQRAWAFFDDERLFNNAIAAFNLPDYALYMAEEVWLQCHRGDMDVARRRALGYVPVMRMALFQSSGREALVNKAKDYPAFVEKTEQAFWMREMDECPAV